MKALELEESKQLIEDISILFIQFLADVLEETNTSQVNLVGIGNSISAGWTAVDNNVQPWVEKSKKFLLPKCQRAGINLEYGTFTIVNNNSNQEIYQLLKENPTLEQIKSLFLQDFDYWKEAYDNTLFENSVSRMEASKYYSDDSKRFTDFYSSDILTITNFNGCTGKIVKALDGNVPEILRNLWALLTKGKFEEITKNELLYMRLIIELVLKQSDHSYLTIGNFPKLTPKYLKLLNIPIDDLNRKIQHEMIFHEQARLFDEIYLDLINIYDKKVKIDNHPNLKWQYTSLYKYLIFLLKRLPDLLNIEEEQRKKLKTKYENKTGTFI